MSETPSWTECLDSEWYDCDDIYPHECYNETVFYNCCETCTATSSTSTTTTTVTPPPQYTDDTYVCNEDQVAGCAALVDYGMGCYNSGIRDRCCLTCEEYYTDIPGCPYGDKIETCDFEQCSKRGDNYRLRTCCDTCLPPHISTKQTTNRPVTSTVSAASTGMPAWVIPVACVGGVLVVVLVILVCMLWRRRRRRAEPPSFSSMEDRMYNDYKMSKRPPVAPPRHPDMEKDFTKDRKMSAEYAYINPDDVSSNPRTGSRKLNPRQGTDPLPQPPGEYLELSAPEYSYADHTQDAKAKSDAKPLHDAKGAKGEYGAISNPGYDTKPPETI